MNALSRSAACAALLLFPAMGLAPASAAWAQTATPSQQQQEQLPDAPSTPRPRPTPAPQTAPPQAVQPQSAAPAPAPAAPQPAAQRPVQPTAQPAPGQQQDPAATAGQSTSPDDSVTTIKVQAREVNLVFTVTDKKGRFITGLHQQNFGLLDDGYPPLSVTGFKQQTDLPLRVGILVDTSSSIRSRFQFEQQSALEFFLQVMHSNDRAFVAGFDIKTELTQDYTNSVGLLNQGITKLRPGGGTALFDALYTTCRDQMLTLRDENAVRRVLILVSDGDDNYSRALESDAIKECQRAETIVYSISTNVSPSKDKGDEVLRQISEATGGRPFFPTKIEDVATGFHNIELELRSQYSLQYRPANFKADGSFRTIYLTALDPRYHVSTRKGYFAPRPQ